MKKSDEIYTAYAGALDDNNLKFITKFLICFGRFENALKRAGYAYEQKDKKGKHTYHIIIAHDKFALKKENEMKFHQFEESKQHQESLNKLFSEPPQKQYFDDNDELKFSDKINYPRKMKGLIDIIKTVRNNLFHGGKYQRPEKDTARDTELIQMSLFFLDEIIKDSEFSIYYEVSYI